MQLLRVEGFVLVRPGAEHYQVAHPDHPDLQLSVPRHTKIKAYLVRAAVAIIETARERSQQNEPR
jgi:hypothetical protein